MTSFTIYSWLFIFICVQHRVCAVYEQYQIQSSQVDDWAFINISCSSPGAGLTKNIESHVQDQPTFNEFSHSANIKNNLKNNQRASRPVDGNSKHDYVGPNQNVMSNNSKLEEDSYFNSDIMGYDDSRGKILERISVDPNDENYISGETDLDSIPVGTSQRTINIRNAKIGGAQRLHVLITCYDVILSNRAVNSSVQSLFLSSDGSLTLKPDWISSETKLRVLKLWSKNGLHLPAKCSWLPKSVEQLDMSHFSFEESDLSDCRLPLRRLSVAGAELDHFSICLPKLKHFDASWNSLILIQFKPRCEFENGIEEVKLSHNKLENWSSCGWSRLTQLIVDHNKLNAIDLSSCSSEKLFHINAEHNNLHEIPDVLPPRLSYLNLNHNKINSTVKFEGSLQVLDLSHNLITAIAKETFKWAWQLLTLDLSHNQLTVIYGHDFVGARQLRFVDLSHNSLRHVRHEAFRSLQSLETLHLTGNDLHQLDSRIFSSLPQNLDFQVHDNPWRCSCHLLSLLSTASRRKCNPNCRKESKLKCKEGSSWVSAQVILQRCIEAIDDLSESINVRYQQNRESDEDLSEEIKNTEDISLVAIPGGVLLIAVLVGAAVGSKIYMERKKIKRQLCNCLEPDILGAHNSSWISIKQSETAGNDSETEL